MSDRQYGIFFEDINHGADGGIYPELVQNRSFEFNSTDNAGYDGLTAWSRAGRGERRRHPRGRERRPAQREEPQLPAADHDGGGHGGGGRRRHPQQRLQLRRLRRGRKRYDFSFWARRDGTADLPVRIAVEDAAGATEYAAAEVTLTDGAWKKYTAS